MRALPPVVVVLAGLVSACGGAGTSAPLPPAAATDTFGPLDIGADFQGYERVTAEPYRSKVHGNRLVHVWVTRDAAGPYVDGTEMPVGSVLVKESWQDDGSAGPIFVMRLEPDRTWTYAIHWAQRPEGPIYWRGASPKVDYCRDCHDSYDRGLGGLVPSSVLER